MSTTGLSKCPRCGSVYSGPHRCGQLSVSGQATYELYPPTGHRIDGPTLDYARYRELVEEMRRCYDRTGELLAALDREFRARENFDS